MSVRTYNSAGSTAFGIAYMGMFAFLILLGIVQSRQLSLAAIPGVILCLGCLYTCVISVRKKIGKK